MSMLTKKTEFIRTTIYLPRSLYEQVKIMSILTRSNVSKFMRVALREKLQQLKDKKPN